MKIGAIHKRHGAKLVPDIEPPLDFGFRVSAAFLEADEPYIGLRISVTEEGSHVSGELFSIEHVRIGQVAGGREFPVRLKGQPSRRNVLGQHAFEP